MRSAYRNRTDIGVSSGEKPSARQARGKIGKAVSIACERTAAALCGKQAAHRQIVCFCEGAHLKPHSQSAKSQQEGTQRQPRSARYSTASSFKPLVSLIMPSSTFPYGKKCKNRSSSRSRMENMVRMLVTVSRGRCLLYDAQKIEGNEVRFRL